VVPVPAAVRPLDAGQFIVGSCAAFGLCTTSIQVAPCVDASAGSVGPRRHTAAATGDGGDTTRRLGIAVANDFTPGPPVVDVGDMGAAHLGPVDRHVV